jgi:hypothetical protein
MEYKPFAPGIEVNGQTVYSVVDGFGTFRRVAEQFLVDEGIGSYDGLRMYALDMEGWYPQDRWLRAFEQVANKVGQSVLFDIGRRIPLNAQFPPWVVDVPSAIRSIDIAYHMNHRRGGRVMFDPVTLALHDGIGHYGFEHTKRSGIIRSHCENPYPCAFDEGILTAMAGRFDIRSRVEHQPGPCRRRGSNFCVYIVQFDER